ncbi:MAG: Helix-turn-helix domain [Anaerolineales bacterium]|nr:Helix-turn-helix domain [Anaerolineales bacterium]
MTQHELSRRSGVSQGYISQLEHGSHGSPAVDTAICLAEALGVDLGELVSAIGYRQRGKRRRAKLNQYRIAMYERYAAMPAAGRRLVRELMGMLGALTPGPSPDARER